MRETRSPIDPDWIEAWVKEISTKATARRAAIDIVEAEVREIVRKARLDGCSWRIIGRGLGTSWQAAQERYQEVDYA